MSAASKQTETLGMTSIHRSYEAFLVYTYIQLCIDELDRSPLFRGCGAEGIENKELTTELISITPCSLSGYGLYRTKSIFYSVVFI